MTAVAERLTADLADVGRALAEVHQKQLYRATHETFEGYCRDVSDLARAGATEALLRAAKARVADTPDWMRLIGEANRQQDWKTLRYSSRDGYVRGEGLQRQLAPAPRPRAEIDTRSVYFIQGYGGGLVKIGVAADPEARLAEIQRMCPIPLRILATLQGAGQSTETALHRRFAAHRRHGEWFELSTQQVREVTS